MAVEGKTILQTTERTELTGKEGIPFQEGVENGHMKLENVRRFVMGGLFDTDQFGAPIFVLPKGGKLVTWVDDAAQIQLVFYKEYDNGERQVEVGSPGRNLNLNSSDMVTVELPGGKKERLVTESQLVNATEEKDGLMSKEDKGKLDGIRFSEDENSIWFNGKKYGVYILKGFENLSTDSNTGVIQSFLGDFTYDRWVDAVNTGNIVFVETNNILIPASVYANNSEDLNIMFVTLTYTYFVSIHYSTGSGYSINLIQQDSLVRVADVNNTLTNSSTDKPLSAAMGKELNDKIEAIKSEISALRDEIEALKGSGA